MYAKTYTGSNRLSCATQNGMGKFTTGDVTRDLHVYPERADVTIDLQVDPERADVTRDLLVDVLGIQDRAISPPSQACRGQRKK